MPNRLGNFGTTLKEFEERQTAPLGYAPSDKNGLMEWGIVKPTGEYTDVMAGNAKDIQDKKVNKYPIKSEDVRDFLNWAIVGDADSPFPPLVNLLLCLKYKRMQNAIMSTGTSNGLRTAIKILMKDIQRLLNKQKYPLNDDYCLKVAPRFDSAAVKLKAEKIVNGKCKKSESCSCEDIYKLLQKFNNNRAVKNAEKKNQANPNVSVIAKTNKTKKNGFLSGIRKFFKREKPNANKNTQKKKG